MATGGQFRQLSEIFAEGAEQALGLATFFGYEPHRVANIVNVRFGPLSDDDRRTFEEFAAAGVAAGSSLADLPQDQRIPPGMIPTNPFLYGDEPEGRRVRVIGVIEFPDSGAIIRVYEDFEDLPSVADIIDQLESKGSGIGEAYPAKFGLDPDEEVSVRVVDIAFIEKRF